jgi:hypothetical protein
MAGKKTKSKGSVRIVKVRFLRPVKMGGRWHLAGEEISLSAKIVRDFLRRGLIEKLKDSRGG